MGVSLDYFSTEPVPAAAHRRLLALAAEANVAHDWWCEPIWIADAPNTAGLVFGGTKLFCLIDDPVADAYMAHLDSCEIVRFLASTAATLGVEWRLEIEGSPCGTVTASGPDEELRGNLSAFIDLFDAELGPLRSRPREDILAEWAGRERVSRAGTPAGTA